MASTTSDSPSGAPSSVTSTATSEEFDKATDYSFQEADIEAAKALVGVWSPLNTQEFLTEATYDNMRNFARGYGDDNPLYTSAGYGETTRWGSQIGAPMMPIAMNRPLFGDPPEVKLRRPSFRGIHVFVSGSSWDWFRPINAGDQLFSFGGTEKIVEKDSEFAERSMQLTKTMVRFNQRAEIVAISRTLLIHTERKTARERGKYDEIAPATYTDDDIAEIDAIYAAEQARGSETRWFEDVTVGDALTPMAKGPLTTTDMIVFHAGGYGFIPYAPTTNRVAYKNRQRIAPFYVKNEYGVPDVAQRVHWDSAWAQAIGNPMAYDYGVMRDCWLSHFVTDWMGDDAWLVTPVEPDPQVQLHRRHPHHHRRGRRQAGGGRPLPRRHRDAWHEPARHRHLPGHRHGGVAEPGARRGRAAGAAGRVRPAGGHDAASPRGDRPRRGSPRARLMPARTDCSSRRGAGVGRRAVGPGSDGPRVVAAPVRGRLLASDVAGRYGRSRDVGR